MLILALDLSTRTGWAAGRDFAPPEHGVWVLGKMAGLGRCFSCLADALETALRRLKPDMVIFESPLRPMATNSQTMIRLLIGLAAVAEMIAFEAGVPVEEADCQTARKMVLGRAPRGGTAKSVVGSWCADNGWQPADDNAADALLLLRYRHLLSRMTVMA